MPFLGNVARFSRRQSLLDSLLLCALFLLCEKNGETFYLFMRVSVIGDFFSCSKFNHADDKETVPQAGHAAMALQADRFHQQGHGRSPRPAGRSKNRGRPS